MSIEIPLIINKEETTIFGILNKPKNAKVIIVLIPAATGTRIGPQRIFVEIARKIAQDNIASFRVDIPPSGDSYEENDDDLKNDNEIIVFDNQTYLDLITSFISENYNFNEIVLLSISNGCVPILQYSKQRNYKKVILLSPEFSEEKRVHINRKNIYLYLYKFLSKETWYKIFHLKINYQRILSNTLNIKIKKSKYFTIATNSIIKSELESICIFGGNDSKLHEYLKILEEYCSNNYFKLLTTKIIKGSDHSFFGWGFKKEVIQIIAGWLK